MTTAIAVSSSQLGSTLPIELLYAASALALLLLLAIVVLATSRLRSRALADDVADDSSIAGVRVLDRDDWGFREWIDREGMR